MLEMLVSNFVPQDPLSSRGLNRYYTTKGTNMDRVMKLVNDALECEQKLVSNECLEKCLYHGSGGLPRVAFFKKGVLTVDVIYSKLDCMDDKEFLSELENSTSGKFSSTDKESVNEGKGVRWYCLLGSRVDSLVDKRWELTTASDQRYCHL